MSKRILILTFEFPPYRAGIGRYTAQLALGAHKFGCDVTVVAPDFKQQQRKDEEDQFAYEVRRFKGTVYTASQFPALVQRIRKLVNKESYDIIHAVDWPNCLALTLLNKFRDIPFIATIYGTEVLGVARSRQVRYLSGGKLFVTPSRLLAISQFTKSLLLGRHPEVDADKVQVTPLGVDGSFFDPPGGPNGIRAKFNIPLEKKILLTVSRLDERKGHRVVLQSLASLPADVRSSVAYVVTGEAQNPAYLKELRQLASGIDVPVVFAGLVSENDLRSLYANAYLFCMPGEPNPGKVEG
ncbi:MAG TPA: glycosyltransferase family 4 protein, partial [candidate division Zixibacteria bacterium]|nr:glycosyltransferase family 4 protein [candidate division Zixibacteria bacterium]